MKKIICLFIILTILSAYVPLTSFAKISEDNYWVEMSSGFGHIAAIKTDSSLWTWGDNYSGQLGDGTTDHKSFPVKIIDNVKAVSLGDDHSAAIKTDSSLWTWGNNYSGQLGDGTSEDKHTPVKIMDNVKAVSLGHSNSAVIKTDDSLWTWGDNRYGQLGDGTEEDRYTPVKIMDNVKAVSLGNESTVIIKKDNSLWGCGTLHTFENAIGQELSPIKLLDNVKAVSLGSGGFSEFCAVIQSDNSLWTYGYNDCGQLGDGTTEHKSFPIKIMDNVKAVSLGDNHSAAIKTDGSLWTWGNNYSGQLGDGTEEDRYTPVKIMDNVKAVNLGYNHSTAIKTDGSLWTWGDSPFNFSVFSTNVPVKTIDSIMLPQESATKEIVPVKVIDDNFPENITFDYHSFEAKLGLQYISANDPEATFEIEDTNVAVLGSTLQVADPFTGEYSDISMQILPISPGNTVITAHFSDGTTKKCNLTITGEKITLNGSELEFDQPPINQDGNLLVPIRKIAESMGKTVLWSEKANAAFIDNTNNALIIPIGETTLYLGDENLYSKWNKVKTNVPSQVINGRTLVPIRQFAESLGAKVSWDDKYSTASITYDGIKNEAMASSLFDAINLNYYVSHNGNNPFIWYTDNIINSFYDSRNPAVDALTMGLSDPFGGLKDIASIIMDESNNAANIIHQSLYEVLAEIPGGNELNFDAGIAKTLKDVTDSGFDIYTDLGGFGDKIRNYSSAFAYLDDALLDYAKNYHSMVSGIFDLAVFSLEELAYLLTEYKTNIEYLDIFEKSIKTSGYSNETIEKAISMLREQYTNKFIGIAFDLRNACIEKGISTSIQAALKILGYDTWGVGVGKLVWDGVFTATGINKKGDALKTFYGIYCYNGALDKEFNKIISSPENRNNITYANALINLQKATKITAINNIADMANWWAKTEVNQSAEELKNSLKSWSYHIWK